MIHNNTGITKWIYDLFKLKGESSPVLVSDIIQPVVNVEPLPNVVAQGIATNGTSSTMYTTPTDRDFYLTHASLSVIKDITSTSVVSSITITVNGTSTRVLSIAGITLTPQSESVAIAFSKPIKCDRGTVISVNNSTNVANIQTCGCISGFVVE